MYKRHITGKEGEDTAEKYLLKNGYEILERNFNCRQGEIDIIAKENDEIVFIEVKTRRNKKYGEPIEAVTHIKIKHLIRSIEYYLYIKDLEDSFIRIDVIEIYQSKYKTLLHHIKNAITM